MAKILWLLEGQPLMNTPMVVEDFKRVAFISLRVLGSISNPLHLGEGRDFDAFQA
ncbi:hypothetical protein ELAC_0546 [Estrella lausannensis]|uniref:Uncharacterized protein n=1 Tax=Estrella lausannensis TaxID=483423 RepID=A0A0H5DNI6_9BACT|nr:hypothetical protein ELAC_0546 [Estrella lausannensis]